MSQNNPTEPTSYLFILDLEGGQPRLQLVVPHQQLGLHRLLGAHLAHLGQETFWSCMDQTHTPIPTPFPAAPPAPGSSREVVLPCVPSAVPRTRTSTECFAQHSALSQLQQVNHSSPVQIWGTQGAKPRLPNWERREQEAA